MVDLSSEFRGLSAKIYTFSFLCLTAKLLKVSSVSQAGVKIEFANSPLMIGALAVVAFLLTISAAFKLLTDTMRTRVADEVRLEEIGTHAHADLKHDQNCRLTFSEKHFELIKFSEIASFTIEAILPLATGLLTSWYASRDMVEFLKEITR